MLKTQLKLVVCFFASCALLVYGLTALMSVKAGLRCSRETAVQTVEFREATGSCDWAVRELNEEGLVPDFALAEPMDFNRSVELGNMMLAGYGEVAQPSGGLPPVLLSRPPPTTL